MSKAWYGVVLASLFAHGCAKTPVVGASGSEAEHAELERALPVDPDVLSGTFDNGLTWFVERNAAPSNRADIRLVVRAGSVLEDDDQRGAAHFVEHMAFNGTERFEGNELVAYLESIGAQLGPDLNAHTAYDETVYRLQVPTSDPALLETGFEVLEQWATGVTFDPDEIEAERGVVLEEWRRTRGATGRALDRLLPVLFHDSAYADRTPIGTEASLQRLGRDELVRFYEDWYRPDLMAVVAVGDFDPDQVRDLITAHFAGIPEPASPRERPLHRLPDHEPLFTVMTDPEVAETTVEIVEKEPWMPENTWGAYRQHIVQALFFSILNDRLHQRSQRTDAPFLLAMAGREPLTPTNQAFVLRAIVPEGRVEEGLDALVTEARRLKVHGCTEQELERARNQVMGVLEAYWEERETTASSLHADEIVRHYLTPEAMPGLAWEHGMHRRWTPKVTRDDLRAFADRWMDGGSRVFAVHMPDKPGLAPPDEDGLAAVVREAEAREVAPPAQVEAVDALVDDTPKPGRIVDEQLHPDLGLVTWRLSNGARVMIMPTPFKADDVRMLAWSWGGHSRVDDAGFVPASTAAPIAARSGLGDLDRTQLEHYLSGRSARIVPYISEDQEGLVGFGTRGEIETMLQLAHLHFTAPRFTDEAFSVERQLRREILQNRRAQPEAVYQDEINRVLWQDHPRRRPWTVDDVDRMDLAASERVFRERFGDASDFTFVFVGSMSPKDLKPHVRTWLASLPSHGERETWRDVGARAPDGVVEEVVYKGLAPQSMVTMVFHGEYDQSVENDHLLDSVCAALQTRLRDRLREELGGTYDVAVQPSTGLVPTPSYRVTIRFGTDPDRVDEMSDALFEEIARLRDAPVPKPALATLQEQQRREFELLVSQNSWWLDTLVSTDQLGLDPTVALRRVRLVDGLTPQRLQDGARTYLRPDRYVRVVLMPEGQARAD